jgi:hypothetical protein
MWQCASMISGGAEGSGTVGTGQLTLNGGAFRQPLNNDRAAATRKDRREASSVRSFNG